MSTHIQTQTRKKMDQEETTRTIITPFDNVKDFEPNLLNVIDSYCEQRLTKYFPHWLKKWNVLHNVNLAFLFACKNGFLDIVKYCLDQGVNVHRRNELGFRRAAQNGHMNVVKYLVSLGVDIHAVDEQALRYAAYKNHFEVVKYLVSLGANVTIKDNEAIILACYHGNLELVKYLTEYVETNYFYLSHDILKMAITNGHLNIVKFFVNDNTLNYALNLAAKHKKREIETYLLSLGARYDCLVDFFYKLPSTYYTKYLTVST